MKHHASCKPNDTGLYRCCDQCGEKESADDVEAALKQARKALALVDKWWFDPAKEKCACSSCEANLHENCMGKHQQLDGAPCPIQVAHDTLRAIDKAMRS